MPKKVLNDGRLRETTMPATCGLPSVDYSYRPAATPRVAKYQHDRRGDNEAEMAALRALIKEHLVAWDVADLADETKAAPITDASLNLAPRPLLDHICDSICRYRHDPKEAVEEVKN